MSRAKSEDVRTDTDSSKTLSSTVIKGGGWLGSAALLQAILQIVIFAALARLLTPTDFGLVAIAGIFIDLAAGIAAMGASQALVQRPDLTDEHIRAAFWISMATGASATTALFFLSPLLADVLGTPTAAPLIAALSFSFVIRALGSVPEGLAARRLNFRILAIRQLAAYVVGYGIVGTVSAVLGAGPWALVYAQLTQVTLAAALLIAAIRFTWRPTKAIPAYRDIIGFGSGFSVARVANSFANQVDRAIVSVNMDAAAVGLYTRSLQITRYPTTLVGQVIEDVLFPSFSGVQSERQRLAAAYYKSIGAIFTALTPITVFCCIAAQPIVDLLLGSQWVGAVPLIVALGISIPFRSAQRISSALLRSVGRSWLVAALQIFLLAVTAGGTLIGIQWGLLGVSIAVAGALILHYVALGILCVVLLRLNFRKLLARHLSGVPLGILAAAGAGLGFVVRNELHPIATLALSAFSAATISLLAITLKPRLFLLSDGIWLTLLLASKLPGRWRKRSLVSSLIKRIDN
jgi:O-antigen/teichoic acid export membrane protein